ncbi:MAG: Crp/Fnr family transcriptional regulator [Chloroflexota bacterium]|nr:Crp/Fnr family transcriptional regulator [Chloroflexota bacterium]
MTKNRKRKTPLSKLIATMTREDNDFQDAVTMRSARRGEIIARSDELTEKLFILMNGRAQLVCNNKEGRRMMVSRLGPGSIFGDGAMLNQNMSSGIFAEALDDCTIWVLPEGHAKTMTERYPIIGWGMLQTFGRRLRQVEDRLEEVAYKKLPQRLARLLLDMSLGDEDTIRTSHQALADMLGTYRETVSTILRGFKADGMVELGYRRICVTDPVALKELASSWN